MVKRKVTFRSGRTVTFKRKRRLGKRKGNVSKYNRFIGKRLKGKGDGTVKTSRKNFKAAVAAWNNR